jgi:phosphosulfolactate synthase
VRECGAADSVLWSSSKKRSAFASRSVLLTTDDVSWGAEVMVESSRLADYLDVIGVRELPPATCPFDPGVAPAVLVSHLEQSAHLMLSLKISMACWMIATESATRQKVAAARAAGVPTSTGGGPYEVALAQRRLPEYLDLCGDIGFNGIECGAGFTTPNVNPEQVVEMAAERGLTVEYELGKKHSGEFGAEMLPALVTEGRRWLDAGARRLVVEARESAAAVGLFDATGRLNAPLAERLAEALGLASLVFEAPSKRSQFALLAHFGPKIALANVPLDELLRVEIYRRGLHSDAFPEPNLRPSAGRACSAGLSR